MLGYEAVVTAVVQGGRTPAEQVRWVPWGEPREPERPLEVGTETDRRGRARCRRRIPRACSRRPCPRCCSTTAGPPVRVSGRGERRPHPARAASAQLLAGGGGPVRAWAGPWAHDVRWWDPRIAAGARCWQVVVEGPDAGEVACLVALEAGTAGIEAIYD